MKQNSLLDTDKAQQENTFPKETPVIQMMPKENTPLQIAMVKVNGVTTNVKEHNEQHRLPQTRIRRGNRLRL